MPEVQLRRGESRVCKACGKEFISWRINRSSNLFCSRSCSSRYQGSRRKSISRDLDNFKEYIRQNLHNKALYRTKRWRTIIRRQVLERDEYTCQFCGWKPTSSRMLDVHHIDDDITNNLMENLITLCKVCHRTFGERHVKTRSVEGDARGKETERKETG